VAKSTIPKPFIWQPARFVMLMLLICMRTPPEARRAEGRTMQFVIAELELFLRSAIARVPPRQRVKRRFLWTYYDLFRALRRAGARRDDFLSIGGLVSDSSGRSPV
jgi:hypothetical protein